MRRLLFLLSVFQLSYSFAQTPPVNLSNFGLKGKVKVIHIRCFSAQIANGQPQKGESLQDVSDPFADPTEISGKLEFDKEGKLYKHTCYDQYGNPYSETEYVYDHDHRLARLVMRNQEAETTLIFEYDYNEKGQLATELRKSFGMTVDSLTYLYDESGNLKIKEHFDRTGLLRSKSVQSYDPNGRMIEVEEFLGDRRKLRHLKYVYDDQGRKKMELIIDQSGQVGTSLLYNYDKKGNIIRRENYIGETKKISTEEYKYDKYNNCTSQTLLTAEGTINKEHLFVFIYDRKGNWTKKMIYTANICVSMVETEVTYY